MSEAHDRKCPSCDWTGNTRDCKETHGNRYCPECLRATSGANHVCTIDNAVSPPLRKCVHCGWTGERYQCIHAFDSDPHCPACWEKEKALRNTSRLKPPAEYAEPSLRDVFAASALQGLCSNGEYKTYDAPIVADIAYNIADAMMERRAKV